MPELTLSTDVQFLPGVGPDVAPLLSKLKIETLEDLLWHLPRDVLDFTHVARPEDLKQETEQSVQGIVVDVDVKTLRNGRTLTACLLDCGSGYVRGVWFNQPWMRKKLQDQQRVLFSGKPKVNQGRWEFTHPEVQWLDVDDEGTGGLILTRYRLTEGLKLPHLKRLIATALTECDDQVCDRLPESFLELHQLPSLRSALRNVHQPESMEEYTQARKRIVFEDLLEFQLGVALRRRQWDEQRDAPVFQTSAKIDSRIRRLFPFEFTDGQKAAIQDVVSDVQSGNAMHRLLQADVGAGKTAVAAYAMLLALANGSQSVLMAPTELLANQHAHTLRDLLSGSDVDVEILTGSLRPAARRETLDRISSGDVKVIVGTQAVIQEGVAFANLGLVVIDEQHKFGVAQRAKFSRPEGQLSPHVLVMTATPIPRSLCLTQFGDLDLTVVKDQPQGRQPVVTTRIQSAEQKKKAWDFLKEKLGTGRQMYVVCPLVEENSNSEQASAEQIYKRMQQSLPDFRLGLVHGRMDRDLREETMLQFRDHEVDVLVSTTVIEVGVDVSNATLMVILDAERFGLSQLHQLRGRVARGKFRGFCFLVSEATSPEAVARLSVLEETSDGFVVAEKDFELRGPGDILGTRQHGSVPLRFGDFLRDSRLLTEARDEAGRLVESGEFDTAEYSALKHSVLDRFSQLFDLPQSG